jgi:hypothetical protein
VPYVEESVFSRARKMLRVMTGSASMKRRPPEPKTVARPERRWAVTTGAAESLAGAAE